MDHTTGLYWKFTPQIPISFLLTAHHTMYSRPRGIYMANLPSSRFKQCTCTSHLIWGREFTLVISPVGDISPTCVCVCGWVWSVYVCVTGP